MATPCYLWNYHLRIASLPLPTQTDACFVQIACLPSPVSVHPASTGGGKSIHIYVWGPSGCPITECYSTQPQQYQIRNKTYSQPRSETKPTFLPWQYQIRDLPTQKTISARRVFYSISSFFPGTEPAYLLGWSGLKRNLWFSTAIVGITRAKVGAVS